MREMAACIAFEVLFTHIDEMLLGEIDCFCVAP